MRMLIRWAALAALASLFAIGGTAGSRSSAGDASRFVGSLLPLSAACGRRWSWQASGRAANCRTARCAAAPHAVRAARGWLRGTRSDRAKAHPCLHGEMGGDPKSRMSGSSEFIPASGAFHPGCRA